MRMTCHEIPSYLTNWDSKASKSLLLRTCVLNYELENSGFLSKTLPGDKAWCWLSSVAVRPAGIDDSWVEQKGIQVSLRKSQEATSRWSVWEMVISLLSLHFGITQPIHGAWLCYCIIKQTPKNPRETVGSRQTSLVWHGNMHYCAEEYEKSCKKQTLHKTACGRLWTVKSSNEALKLPFPFFCSHSCITCKLHFFGLIFYIILKYSCSTHLTWHCPE